MLKEDITNALYTVNLIRYQIECVKSICTNNKCLLKQHLAIIIYLRYKFISKLNFIYNIDTSIYLRYIYHISIYI